MYIRIHCDIMSVCNILVKEQHQNVLYKRTLLIVSIHFSSHTEGAHSGENEGFWYGVLDLCIKKVK